MRNGSAGEGPAAPPQDARVLPHCVRSSGHVARGYLAAGLRVSRAHACSGRLRAASLGDASGRLRPADQPAQGHARQPPDLVGQVRLIGISTGHRHLGRCDAEPGQPQRTLESDHPLQHLGPYPKERSDRRWSCRSPIPRSQATSPTLRPARNAAAIIGAAGLGSGVARRRTASARCMVPAISSGVTAAACRVASVRSDRTADASRRASAVNSVSTPSSVNGTRRSRRASTGRPKTSPTAPGRNRIPVYRSPGDIRTGIGPVSGPATCGLPDPRSDRRSRRARPAVSRPRSFPASRGRPPPGHLRGRRPLAIHDLRLRAGTRPRPSRQEGPLRR